MKYDDLTHEQLVSLLVKRDAQRRLGLVWERDEIAHDQALNGDFVTMDLDQGAGGSCGSGPWDNMVIEGDNFDALRWLRMTHAGQVRCILIDPPYNTGNQDFVYNDSFVGLRDRFRQSTWLEFLYQRLALARDLLSEDGVILACINDENRSKLDLLMEDIFPGMRVGSFVWRTKDTNNSDKRRNWSGVHEHILVYAKPGFSFITSDAGPGKFKKRPGLGDVEVRLDPITKAGTYTSRENTYYPIQNPETGLWYPCAPNQVWRFWSEVEVERQQEEVRRTPLDEAGKKRRPAKPGKGPSMESYLRAKEIYFPPETEPPFLYPTREALDVAIASGNVPRDGKGRALLRPDLPRLDFWVGKLIARSRLSRIVKRTPGDETPGKPVGSWIAGMSEDTRSVEVDILRSDRQGAGTVELERLFGRQVFSFPKPSGLIRELVRVTAGEDDIVLDFFAGSGTTAHAVLALNAEDDGRRRFILVSSREATKDNPDQNLCRNVCAERVRRIIEGYSDVEGLGGNFAYLETRRIEFEDLAYDLRPEHIWLAVQAIHGMPLSPVSDGADVQLACDEEAAVAFCDRFTAEAERTLRDAAARHHFLVVYAYAPRPVRDALDGANNVEVRALPDYLVRRFQG